MLRGLVLSLAAAALACGAPHGAAVAQDAAALRFDRPIFTTDGAVLCARQEQIALLRRASEDSDRAAFDRATRGACRTVGPDIRLTVVAMPGLYDPDVEVRVSGAQGLEPGVPRGKMWTLKSMVRN
jgi:hypothetical protein